jgi:hypothetical protein
MRKVLFFTILLTFLLTSSVWAADVSGEWAVTMKSPQGQDESFDILIKAAGENLTITSSNHPVLENLEGKGTLKGDAISMDLKSTGGQMAGVGIIFTGKVSGNKMSGTREIDTSGMGGGAAGGGGGAAAGGQGREGGAQGGGQAPAGGGGGAPGGGEAPAGGGGGAPGGAQGGAAGGGEDANTWSAIKK